MDTETSGFDWFVFGTLVVAVLTLIVGLMALAWSIRSRQSPVWSLGSAWPYPQVSKKRNLKVMDKSSEALMKAGYPAFPRTHDDRQFFMLYCEGEMSASRVRFSVTPGFAVGVTRFGDDGELTTSVALQTAHITVVEPGTRHFITVAPPKGVSIDTGYLYVRWSRIPARFGRDDVQALALNLGKDYRLTRAAKRQIRKTAVKPKDVFPQ